MTESDKALMLQMWQDGKSATEIGLHFGVTKNVIIGKIYRMRQKGVVMERKADKKKVEVHRERLVPLPKIEKIDRRETNRPQSVKVIQFPLKLVHSVDVPTSPKVGILLECLTVDSCRYILSDHHFGQAVYCGDDKKRGAYCEDHAKLCYISKTEYKRTIQGNGHALRKPRAF